MHYGIAFSRIAEPELRRLILGDGEHEPLTALAYVSPQVWNGVKEIAKRDKKRICRVLACAVRNYVVAEGFGAPNVNGCCAAQKAKDTPNRPKLMAMIAKYFKR